MKQFFMMIAFAAITVSANAQEQNQIMTSCISISKPKTPRKYLSTLTLSVSKL
jgi:hypothetical protein